MATLFNRNWKRQELLQYVGDINQIAGIKPVEASEGTERDSRILQAYTGSGLTFDVVADRALDIAACRYKGVPLAWLSPVGVVHPAYSEPEGLGWLRSFGGGLLTTCGLDHFGPPCNDNGQPLGLHGRISNLPAYGVNYQTSWVDDNYKMQISGQVRQTSVFGENLLLKRCITTHLGSGKIRIEDEIINEGFEPQPHMILYHFNLGFPLIGPDTHLRLDAEETTPRDADAAPGLEQWSSLQRPTAGYREQVFRHKPVADSNGLAHVAVENPVLGLGVHFSFNLDVLPYLVQWKMMGQGTYVLGIEPANCGVLQGRAVAREENQLPYLDAGESRRYVLELEVRELS